MWVILLILIIKCSVDLRYCGFIFLYLYVVAGIVSWRANSREEFRWMVKSSLLPWPLCNWTCIRVYSMHSFFFIEDTHSHVHIMIYSQGFCCPLACFLHLYIVYQNIGHAALTPVCYFCCKHSLVMWSLQYRIFMKKILILGVLMTYFL